MDGAIGAPLSHPWCSNRADAGFLQQSSEFWHENTLGTPLVFAVFSGQEPQRPWWAAEFMWACDPWNGDGNPGLSHDLPCLFACLLEGKGKKIILKKFEKQLNLLFQEDFPGGCYGYPKNRNLWTALRFGLQLPGCPGLSETSGAATSGDALFHQNCSVSVAKLSALAQQQPPPICTSVSLVSGLEL